MFCTQCGTKLKEDSLFCDMCGAPVSESARVKVTNSVQATPTSSVQARSISLSQTFAGSYVTDFDVKALKRNILLIAMGIVLLFTAFSGVFKLYVEEGYWSEDTYSLWDLVNKAKYMRSTPKVMVGISAICWMVAACETVTYFVNWLRGNKWDTLSKTIKVVSLLEVCSIVLIRIVGNDIMYVNPLGWFICVAALINAFMLSIA